MPDHVSAGAAPTDSERLVALLTSGLVAGALRRELFAEFSGVEENDLFLGMAGAVTKLQARIAVAEFSAKIADKEAEYLVGLARGAPR